MTFVAVYLVCVLAPSVALAYMDGPSAFHCLTTQHEHGSAHVHDAKMLTGNAVVQTPDALHHDVGHSSGQNKVDDQAMTINCCGLFCVSAMPTSPVPHIVPIARIVPAVVALYRGIAGRGPDRIYRPPIAVLPL